jgi:hypothetical protein
MKRLLSLLLVLVLLLPALLFALPAGASTPDYFHIKGTRNHVQAQEILRLTNLERAKAGAPALQMDTELLDAAMVRAAELVIDFSHTRPDGTRWPTVSPKLGYAGENIAAGGSSAAGTVGMWMKSTGHKDNILDPAWQSVGMGCFYQANGTWCWVQIFSADTAVAAAAPANAIKTERIAVMRGRYPLTALEKSVDLATGNTTQITITATNHGWVAITPTISPESFNWTSNKPEVAKVDKTGKVTGVKAGTAVITATTVGGTKVTTTVTVSKGKKFSKSLKPRITGTVKVGKTMKVKTGTWSPKPKFTYQWCRNGKAIAGAKKSSYKLVKADKGKKISVKVTGAKSGYTTKTVKSAATAKVK